MKYLYLALAAVLIFAACNKTPKTTTTMEDMLRSGRWKVTGGTLSVKLPDGKHDTALQYLNWIPFCHRDDYIVFDSQMNGAVYSSTIKCNASDPDHIPFVWQLRNNNTTMDLYNGFSSMYAVSEYLLPYNVDTSSFSPLALDTLYGVNDTTEGFTRKLIVLDSFWTLKFDSTSVVNTNIYGGTITNFSQSSFTLNFYLLSTYIDSTNFHTGYPDLGPITRADTFKYSVIYSNF